MRGNYWGKTIERKNYCKAVDNVECIVPGDETYCGGPGAAHHVQRVSAQTAGGYDDAALRTRCTGWGQTHLISTPLAN